MPRRPRAQQAKAQNAAQACEAYKQVTRKVQKATIEEVEDEDASRHHHDPDMCTHNESPLEDPEIVEITNEFVHIQEGGFLGCGPELDDDEDEDDPDPSIEIQELTDLEVFTQTLQKAHDAATAAERKCQKGNKRPRRYLGNSKRTWRRHELNRKELEKNGFTSVIQWLAAAQREKRDGSVSTKCSSNQAEADYVSSDEELDDEVRDFIEGKEKRSTC